MFIQLNSQLSRTTAMSHVYGKVSGVPEFMTHLEDKGSCKSLIP